MKTIYAIRDNETEEVVLLTETIDDAQETVLSLQEEAMYERFLSDTVRFTSSYLTIKPEKWWSEVADLKDWYSKLQAMKSPYITTEGFAIQFKSHEYYIEERTIL